MIDPTFGQFRRPWCEWIPNVAIVKDLAKGASVTFSADADPAVAGLMALAHYQHEDGTIVVSCANAKNRDWRKTPAATIAAREHLVKSLIATFAKGAIVRAAE